MIRSSLILRWACASLISLGLFAARGAAQENSPEKNSPEKNSPEKSSTENNSSQESATQSPASNEAPASAEEAADKVGDEKEKKDWRSLLPKEGLKGWEITDFGTEEKVTRQGDMLLIEMGDPLNGINYLGKDFPTDNFEISVEAKRIEGSDFLCGLTFPVGKEFCSFIAGGWGGNLVGISCIDGFDASENETSTYSEFENDKWYRFVVRVDPVHVTAWIDDEKFFYVEREGREFSTRIEVFSSQPLGYCTFQSKVLVRDFKWRPLKSEDGKKAASKDSPARPVLQSAEIDK